MHVGRGGGEKGEEPTFRSQSYMYPLDGGAVGNSALLGIISPNPEKASCIISEANDARGRASILSQTHVRKRCEEEGRLIIHFGKWGDETYMIKGHNGDGFLENPRSSTNVVN